MNTGLQGALCKVGLLGLTLQGSQLIAVGLQGVLGLHDPLVQHRMALLGVGQLQVQGLKTGFIGHAAGLQLLQTGVHLVHIMGNLFASGTGLFGLLVQAQAFNLQGVGAGLGVAGFFAQHREALGGV